eukprot:TRINITY_DN2115_c0_g1_i2.p2 TRINITY_DN2115_c0_g1~~TRINITY_DN2115_c0_g1_i2.p2  ORF type:complete len:136 (-),score=23.23 TRINITY_DN2115_c0_g1_i2:455-862(-)
MNSTVNAFAVGMSPIARFFVRVLWHVVMTIFFIISIVPGVVKRLPWLRFSTFNASREQDMKEAFGDKPQLYITGDKDYICVAWYIEKWAREQQKRIGEDKVLLQRWPDVGHVMAMRDHAKEYSEKIGELVSKCFK